MNSWITIAIAILGWAAVSLSSAQEAEQTKNQYTEILRRMQRVAMMRDGFYSNDKVDKATKTLEGAQQLVDETRAVMQAHEAMLGKALVSAPPTEIAIELISALDGLDLSTETMKTLCNYLGTKNPAGRTGKSATVKDEKTKQALAWLKNHEDFPDFPACWVLARQRESAILVLREFISDRGAFDLAFDNGVRLLVKAWGKAPLLQWATSNESKLDPAKRSRIKKLVAATQ
jgi:hypothetical protein